MLLKYMQKNYSVRLDGGFMHDILDVIALITTHYSSLQNVLVGF